MLAQSALQADGDVERSAGRNGTPDTRHCDDGDILDLNVCGWLGNEHEALIQAVKQSLVCLDRALDSTVTVVADEVFRRHDDFLSRETAEDLGDNLVDGLFVAGL